MNNTFFRSNRKKIYYVIITAAIVLTAAVFLKLSPKGRLIVSDAQTGEIYGEFPLNKGDGFSVEFIHSVNKSPLEDFYEIRDDGIYVVKTRYYGFGAGVQTELEDGQKLEMEEDGSMVITGFEHRIEDLQYIVGTVSDHVLRYGKYKADENYVLDVSREISLRQLCGRNSRVRFTYKEK